jgi:hypothetical protein
MRGARMRQLRGRIALEATSGIFREASMAQSRTATKFVRRPV